MIVPFWRDNLQLWSWTYKLYPDNKGARQQYLSAVFEMNLVDLLEEEIQNIMGKSGIAGLDPDLQGVYGRILLKKRDPASLDYLERLVGSSGDFRIHETENLAEARKHVDSGHAQIATFAYLNYSQAVFIFKKDPVSALELNEIAHWYSGIVPRLRWLELEYNQIAYLYALGRFDEADALYEALEPSDKEEAKKTMVPMLGYYCGDWGSAQCKALLERGTLTATDLLDEQNSLEKDETWLFPMVKSRQAP
jgi:hypothetical protein